jgi:uncharacterized membrane protein YsdA (DUF1294 family)
MAHDKQAAKKKQWRVKESTLITMAALGGSVGMLFAMNKLNHKTRHNKFKLGVPMILICQIALVIIIVIIINK